jgi:hypothetical protein
MVSCGPSRHAIPVEMRYPSRSGIDLVGKNVSVIYGNADDDNVNSLSEKMAMAFARTLETDYGTGEGSIGVYAVDKRRGEYTSRDSLLILLGKTGADVVILMNASPVDVEMAEGSQIKVTFHCYDGMNMNDKVQVFAGNTVLSSSGDRLESEIVAAGARFADAFKIQWKQEQYSIAYYDNILWYEALSRAEQFDWKGAMDIWFTLLDTNDMMKRATAEYDIALACYMLGDMYLAEDWLKKSMKDNDMPTLTEALLKRIEARKK